MIGVVILYNPDEKKVLKNISTYIHSLTLLLVYDNSEKYNPSIEISLINYSNKIKYFSFLENKGIAFRLNQAIEFAKKYGYDFLLTMDQDSSFSDDDIENYFSIIKNNKIANVAQFGINCQPSFTKILSKPEIAISLITSGSVINLKHIDNVGIFDESFFIDFVDTEFSYRVTNKGYINLLCSNIVLNHSIGNLILARSFVNFRKSQRIIHSPIRVYYILRNGLFLLFRNKSLTYIQKKDVIRSMKIIKNDLLYNPNLREVYFYIFRAFRDFVLNKMGKISN